MKDVATTCVLRAVNASKYVCEHGSAPDLAGSLQRSRAPPSLIWGGEGEEGMGRKGKGTEGRERGGEVTCRTQAPSRPILTSSNTIDRIIKIPQSERSLTAICSVNI